MNKYAAFVSYSRNDETIVSELRHSLHSFSKRLFELRALRLFLDSAGVRAGEPVWDELTSAMDVSQYLLLVATASSAASTWVNKEVTYWLAGHPLNTIIIVHAGGKLRWDEDADNFDDYTDALPDVLRGRFKQLPSIIDIQHLDPRGALYREQVAIIAARLHGERKEDLYDRDINEHRKLQRLQRTAVVVLAVLLVLSLVGAAVALTQRDDARTQARLALSRALAAESAIWVPKDIDLGALLAVEAYRTDDTVQARSALLDALMADPPLKSIFRVPGSLRQLSPVGNEVAVRGKTGVAVWSVASERRLGRPFGTERRGQRPPPTSYPALYNAAFSPDGRQLAVYTPVGDIQLWQLATHRLLASARDPAQNFDSPVEPELAYSPDGRYIVSTGWNGAYVFDAATLRLVAGPLPIPGTTPNVLTAAFSPNAQLLALSGEANTVIYNTVSWRPAGSLTSPLQSVDLAFSPDGRQLAVLSNFGAQLYDVALTHQHLSLTGPVKTMDGPLNQYTVAWNRSGSLLATGGDNGTVIWGPQTGRAVTTLRVHPPGSRLDDVTNIAFDASGQHLISSGADGVVTWQLDRSELTTTAKAGPGAAASYTPTFSPGGRLMATADGTRGVLLWNANSAKLTGQEMLPPGISASAVTFSPNGKDLIVGARGGIWVWDIRQRRRLGTAMPDIYSAPADKISPQIDDIAVSPHGRYVAAAEYWGITVWDLRTHHVALQAEMPTAGANDSAFQLAFSPDGSTLAVPDGNNVELWSITSRRVSAVIHAGGAVDSVAFAPDGQFLAVNTAASSTRLWNLRNHQWMTPAMSDGSVSSVGADQDPVAVSADSSLIATASGGEDTVTLWDVATGDQVGVLSPPSPASRSTTISGLAFSPTGQTLAVTTTAGTISLWNLDPRRWVSAACAIAGRDLTPTEWREFVGPTVSYRVTC